MGSNEHKDPYCDEIPRIITEDTPVIMSLMGGSIGEGIYHPEKGNSTDNLIRKVEKWKSEGNFIGFVAGVFDVLHSNHRWYLMEARLELAKRLSLFESREFSQLTRSEQIERVTSSRIKLIVSVDDDAHVQRSKGSSESKPGDRPVLSWIDRARSIRDLSIPVSDDASTRIVNAVTVHSYNLAEPHNSDIALGSMLSPHIWLVATESFAKTGLSALESVREKELDTEIVKMPNHVYDLNPLTGMPYSTSDIVSRLIGK
jgi:hypothetical protein